MKIKLFVLSLASCLELLAASGSVQAQILLPLGGRGAYGAGIYQPYNTGLGYGGYGINRFSNEGRSFTAPGYGFRNGTYGLGNEDFSPYAGTPGEISLSRSPNGGDPLLNAVFAPGTGVSGDISLGSSSLIKQDFRSGPATTSEKIEFHVRLANADAKLYFNGNLVDQRGDDRWLGTIPLTDGGTYAYTVKATWITSAGREVSYSKSLHAKPGQLLTLDFTTRATAATTDPR